MADSRVEQNAPRDAASLAELLPKNGLVYSEKTTLSEVLCKPKLMPIKSITLQKLEQQEAQLLAEKQPENGLS
ncbi:unnamed protein product [Ectocarpus sp. CCAP 1310/34]|nr:unnamed protein product [Ectocarpus sp. CCAP 1310/34]